MASGSPARTEDPDTREAATRARIPGVFDGLSRDITLPPSVIEDAFIEANPALTRDGITVTHSGKSW